MSLMSSPPLTPPTAASLHLLRAAHRRRHLPLRKYTIASSHIAATTATTDTLTGPQSVICGAVARATQIVSVFPIDTVKTRLQSEHATRLALSSSTASSSSMSGAGASAVAAATATSAASTSRVGTLTRAISQGKLYSGVGASLTGQVPYAMLTFGIYETIRSRIPADVPNWLGIMVAAALGDAVGSLWLTPSEVIKSKTQTGLYSSPINAVRAIATQPGNGGPLAFYQGYSAALARDVPFRVVQMILFEQCRALYVKHIRGSENNQQQQRSALSPLENLLIGAVSGSVTAFLTNPLDVIRTRVMSQPIGEHALYKNALDCVVKTLSKEGVGALFKGAGPRTFMVGPASAIFFLTYEGFKTFFRNRPNRLIQVAWTPGARSSAFNHKGLCCSRRRTIT